MGTPQGIPYMANDGETKAYVVSLGTALNYEFGKLGLNVSVLLPAPILTSHCCIDVIF
jgi:short-subunit dehydrogenase